MGTTIVYWDNSGIMENKIETTSIVHWGYVGIMEGTCMHKLCESDMSGVDAMLGSMRSFQCCFWASTSSKRTFICLRCVLPLLGRLLAHKILRSPDC